jgi:hypothetical protein
MKDFKCLENLKSLEKLAWWYETYYEKLIKDEKEKFKNTLYYECFREPENEKEKVGVCISTF